MSGAPTPVTPIDAAPSAVTERIISPRVPVDESVVERLRGVCAHVTLDDDARAEAGRDWWPLAIRWATRGAVPARPAAVARPSDAGQVAAVLSVCHDARVPLTAVAGRSGVCGASVPVFGGVSLDMCGLVGIVDVAGKYYLPQAGAFLVYVVMIVMLLARPNGIIPRKGLA